MAKKRLPYGVPRTPEVHTTELRNLGATDYTCLEFGNSPDKKRPDHQVNTYRHSCGFEFRMTFACFKMCKCPCEVCRGWKTKPTEVYAAELKRKSTDVVPLGDYVKATVPLLHKYVKCGHLVEHAPDSLIRSKSCGKCPVCYPNRLWFSFKIAGRRFKTRSLVEKEFIKYLVKRRNVSVDEIEYEPKGSRIPYSDPLTGSTKSYAPDFKVRDSYVEIKDLSSLGLKYYHWQPQEEALIVNRAKAEAASEEFDDYRIYVFIKGKFVRTRKFWTRKEQTRLLNI